MYKPMQLTKITVGAWNKYYEYSDTWKSQIDMDINFFLKVHMIS